jgi:pyruvate dehydrogenase E1 component alpha subunit
MRHPVVVPHFGATGADLRLVEWHAAEGQKVEAGATLFVVESDKAAEEVPAFRGGWLRQVLAAAGSLCAPGTVVAMLTDTEHEPLHAPGAPRQRLRVKARGVAVADAPTDRADGADAAAMWLYEAFRRMTLIRRYEEHLHHLFLQGAVPGTLHQCQGQEAVAVGVCAALRRDDLMFSTHRPVGHLIAKGASLDAITAEIWGRATGCAGGKGGQMHISDLDVGAMVANAIVGANIPIATGAAIAFRLRGLDRVAVSFFGDGAANIGAFHEGLNLAAVRAAPVVFVCENNLYAASTPIGATMRIADVADRAAGYGMPGRVVDGMDVEAVFAAATEAVARARRGDGPTLIECKTYRYRGHSRGDPGRYRTAEELAAWQARDPIARTRDRLGALGLPAARLAAVEHEAQAAVEAAVAFALASPEPAASSVLTGAFAP